jgi:hypothetical protein
VRLIVIATAVLLAGCRIGGQAKDFAPAKRATGALATVTTGTTTVNGELLEFRDSALVVLAAQLTLVPMRAIQKAQFSDTRVIIESRYALRESEREELRMLARYPYGVPAVALSKLLASKGQTTIMVIDR